MKAFLKIYLMCALAFASIASVNAQAARTVLYKDGTLVINELAKDSAKNSTEHGGVRATRCIWEPMNTSGTNYMWNNKNDVFWGGYRDDITSVIFGTFTQPISVKYWFYELTNCSSMDLENLSTQKITDMSYMFYNCNYLSNMNVDFSHLITYFVTDMSYMFYGCKSFSSLDLSKFYTSNVTNMEGMFMNCINLQSINLSNFNTVNVLNMSHMFEECYTLRVANLSSFNTKNCKTFQDMFSHPPLHSELMFSYKSNLEAIYASPDFVTTSQTNKNEEIFYGLNKLLWTKQAHGSEKATVATDGIFTASPIRILKCPDTVVLDKEYTIEVGILKKNSITTENVNAYGSTFKLTFSDTSCFSKIQDGSRSFGKDDYCCINTYKFTAKKAGVVQAKIYKECDTNINLNFSSIRTIQIKTNNPNPSIKFTNTSSQELTKIEINEGADPFVLNVVFSDSLNTSGSVFQMVTPVPKITTNVFPNDGVTPSPVHASLFFGLQNTYMYHLVGLKPGTAELVVWATDGSGIYKSIMIDVKPKQPNAPSVIETPNKHIYVELGDTFDINYQVLPTTVANSVVWSTDNNWEKIFRLSETSRDGYSKFAAKDTGNTTLTLIASNYDEGGSVRITTDVVIFVSHRQVKEIYDNYKDFDLSVGKTVQLKPSYEPRNATFPYIEYIVVEGDAATVDSSGLVTAVKPGNCTIRAYYWENYNIYTTYTINVKGNTDIDPDVPGGDPETPGVGDEITGLKLDKNELEIALGSSATLTASVLPETASVANLLWGSTNTDIATVDGGIVKAIALGEAKIIVSTKDEAFSDTCHVSVVEQTNIEIDAQSSRFKIYPNPTSATVLISGLEENAQLTLLNINGEVLLRKQVSRSTKLDLQAYPNGVYLIRVGEEVQRIVKK